MSHLTRSDYAQALAVLAHLETACTDPGAFILAAVQVLREVVSAEGVTLSVSGTDAQRRERVALPDPRLGMPARVAIDAAHPGTLVVPLFCEGRTLVSIVLRRQGAGFDVRDRERLELLRPHLAFLYREACSAGRLAARGQGDDAADTAPASSLPAMLTAREREVVRWLAAGKTDAEIGMLLSISTRTVQKHLEHAYIKLGVETRTACVMRALGNGLKPGQGLAQTYNETFGPKWSSPIKSST